MLLSVRQQTTPPQEDDGHPSEHWSLVAAYCAKKDAEKAGTRKDPCTIPYSTLYVDFGAKSKKNDRDRGRPTSLDRLQQCRRTYRLILLFLSRTLNLLQRRCFGCVAPFRYYCISRGGTVGGERHTPTDSFNHPASVARDHLFHYYKNKIKWAGA